VDRQNPHSHNDVTSVSTQPNAIRSSQASEQGRSTAADDTKKLSNDDKVRWFLVISMVALLFGTLITYVIVPNNATLAALIVTTGLEAAFGLACRYYFPRKP